MPEADLLPVGAFTTEAANEAGHRLDAEVFRLTVDEPVEPRSEIEEVRWVSPAEAAALGDRLAPLARLLLESAPDARRPEGA